MGTYQRNNKLTRNSSGNAQPQSSQLAELLWTDSGLYSGSGVRELISTLKKAQAENGSSDILQKSAHARKKPPPLPVGGKKKEAKPPKKGEKQKQQLNNKQTNKKPSQVEPFTEVEKRKTV